MLNVEFDQDFQKQQQLRTRWMVSRVILVVDDDRSVRSSTARLLSASGYTAVEAANAVEALARASELSPALILMDLHMLPSSGLDAARQIKSRAALQHIPIIALSATPPAPDEALHLFHAVLMKPCPADQMVAAIEAATRQPSEP
jgi:CheY-like chemotaxis protein